MTDSFYFHVKEEKPDHHYRTEIPNIIELLGLEALDIAVYFKIKRPAGDSGHCTRSVVKMAKELNVCPNAIRKSIKKLRVPFQLLGGKSLIRSSERKNEDNSNQTNLIVIVNIWPENGAYFRGLKNSVPPSPHEPPPLHDMNPPPSPHEGKEELVKEEPLKETTTTTEEPPKKTPKPKPRSSSSSFCSKKDEVLKPLPLSTQTKFNLQIFSLEILKAAAAKPIPNKIQDVDGHFFALCYRLKDGTQSMETTPSSREEAINHVKSTVQDMYEEVSFPPDHEIKFVKGGYHLFKDECPVATVGYGEFNCLVDTGKIIKYLKEQNVKR